MTKRASRPSRASAASASFSAPALTSCSGVTYSSFSVGPPARRSSRSTAPYSPALCCELRYDAGTPPVPRRPRTSALTWSWMRLSSGEHTTVTPALSTAGSW
jgi:hypothetical protein